MSLDPAGSPQSSFNLSDSSAPTITLDSRDKPKTSTTSTRHRPARFPFTSLRIQLALKSPARPVTKTSASIGHQARVCCVVMTGSVPISHGEGKKQTKAVKKLKSDLLKPAKARTIVADLKKIEVSDSASDHAQQPLSAATFSSTSIPTSAGGFAGLASAKSGAFEALADSSGVIVRALKGQGGEVVAPAESVGLFLYWWGYEITPEIAPFIRYISNFVDMEYAAIQSQNKGGKGVVLAATWLLPVALVPRPWDLPLSRTSNADTSSTEGGLKGQPVLLSV
ncbi:uncharacterized protein JCM6883_005689 [Sporobolomyces salmoneus]|uniref:uncharacterized protein n=1 Tax=Sporobolomyces salmoneus TaxID=183962 RepID=UPI00317A888D